jgi:tetratricopeptide (TPR) repeat protein
MFLERRVYQGSSGRVYPLPCTDRIADQPVPQEWDAVHLENEYLLVTILPALGGRIHRLLDKTNGYDVIYHQPVIKPALVGLAGPWASGGIEFNWPQHHRPSTFMPADVAIERHPDGSVTVWLGEHDPMARMKAAHGVRLHPGCSRLEVVARVSNRTADVQTFLWWANVATRVHEGYQSFFPPDVTHIADHAKRATDTFPHSSGRYYGVDYAARARTGVPAGEQPRQFRPPPGAYAANDLSWYANIPVPTSYMVMGSQEDFFGGYDHRAAAGLVHVANHHLVPGKKQWTWGNHEFGYAWDRHLTIPDPNGEYPPYIELMAGAFTDNQPDFSFLQPGETRTWSQHWYPIRAIGPAQQANTEAAVSLIVRARTARIGVAVTAAHRRAVVTLMAEDRVLARFRRDLSPATPFVTEVRVRHRGRLTLCVRTRDGRELIRYSPRPPRRQPPPAPATEPAAPAEVAGCDELYLTGLHLEQYRHATRAPEDYWREALRRDPGDSRCHLALGRWHLRRGELDAAEAHLRASVARLTARNPNPADGESHYQLGRCLRSRADLVPPAEASGQLAEAYAAYYKATWNEAWQSAAWQALAEIDVLRGDWATARGHLAKALRKNPDHLRARNLQVIVLRRLGDTRAAAALLRETLALDPLDWWARFLAGEALACDNQVRLDLAFDHARAGLYREALAVLAKAVSARDAGRRTLPDASLGTEPMIHYTRAWLLDRLGLAAEARRARRQAAKAPPDYCFPARLEEIAILQHTLAAAPRDARAAFYLGNLLYDRRRHREAIALWQRALRLEPGNAVAWRNLGLGACNVLRRPALARRAYDRALRAEPGNARLLYERDQLWKRLGVAPVRRLRELHKHRPLVETRDDLMLEITALYNQCGLHGLALDAIRQRRFQPWEGGEGQVLAQWMRTLLRLGRDDLLAGRAATAVEWFRLALNPPESLGEARHLLANQSDIHCWLGCACDAAGDRAAARRHWRLSAGFTADFQGMRVVPFSEMTYYSALSLLRLGRRAAARKLLRALLAYARQLARQPAKIDYFATSLPTMLLFADDLAARQATTALFLQAQARAGLGEMTAARRLLREVLQRDPNHALAADLLRQR